MGAGKERYLIHFALRNRAQGSGSRESLTVSLPAWSPQGADHTTSTCRGMKGTVCKQLPWWLGDRGQQGNFSTQKAQAPTPLLSPETPSPPLVRVSRLIMDSPHSCFPLVLYVSPSPPAGVLCSLFSSAGSLSPPILV